MDGQHILSKWRRLTPAAKLSLASLLMIAVVLPLGILLALGPTRPTPRAGGPVTGPTPPGDVTPTAEIFLSPSSVSTDPNGVFVLDIYLDTKDHEVTAADVELLYDDSKVKVQTLDKSDFLPVLLDGPFVYQKETAAKQFGATGGPTFNASARITLGSDPNTPVQGSGKIATVKLQAQESGYTFVGFGEHTLVSAIGSYTNVLAYATGSDITISESTTNAGIKVQFEGVSGPSEDQQLKVIVVPVNTTGGGPQPVPTTLPQYITVKNDGNGVFSGLIESLNPGNWEILIKGPMHLTKRVVKTISSGSNEIVVGDGLLAGDIHPEDNAGFRGNDDINIFDYNKLVEDFGSRMPKEGTPADMDLDGDVDIFDYNLLVGNFNKKGE